jgi:Arc/MetJ family transcription regulator
VTKRLIDLDDELLSEARDALGTSNWKDTVNRALAEVVARQNRASFLDLLASSRYDLDDPDAIRDAWRR